MNSASPSHSEARGSDMPALFVAHAAPTFAQEENATTRFWADLPAQLPAVPKAVLCLSGHWETPSPALSCSTAIQHDFYGFPASLYSIDWPLVDAPDTAAWLQKTLAELGVDAAVENRALDHGVWVPLRKAWPEPPFPVYQLSLGQGKSPEWHLELGRKLVPLSQKGVLVVGSGGISHNLGRIAWQAKENEAVQWADEFMLAVEEALATRNLEQLCHPWQLPNGREAVPTLDHYLPLLVILGMAGDKPLRQLYAGWGFGSLAMHSYATAVAEAA